MGTAGTVVAILVGLTIIAGFVTAVVVDSRAKGHEETEKRLRADRDDYKARVEFMEPRLAKALEENALLQQLHDPSQALAGVRSDLAGVKGDTGMILALLKAQASDIQEAIDRALGGDHG